MHSHAVFEGRNVEWRMRRLEKARTRGRHRARKDQKKITLTISPEKRGYRKMESWSEAVEGGKEGCSYRGCCGELGRGTD